MKATSENTFEADLIQHLVPLLYAAVLYAERQRRLESLYPNEVKAWTALVEVERLTRKALDVLYFLRKSGA
jgi:hypothetical protein